MRKLLLSVLGLIAALSVTAQTPQFVSTEPSNRNVIIEEFTGVNCGYCPDGHRIVREYEEANPGRVFGINIHQGNFAAMYTTQWGNAIANQTGLNGYPSGTVNRHRFGGTATALGRDRFVNAGNQIQAMPSFVNVAAQASIDLTTRTLTVNVEVYYTGDAETGTNLLNVALLQDSIIGPQSGASSNPTQVTADGKYIHMHMLRHLLTGQWGDTVSVEEGVIPQGTLVQRTYTCDLPSYMSDAIVKLNHLNVVVFVTKDKQEIYTGTKCVPSIIGERPPLSVGSSETAAVNIYGCSEEVMPYLFVYNTGGEALTTMDIEYSSDLSAAQTYSWTGNIATDEAEYVQLPNVLANVGSNTTVTAKILTANGVSVQDEAKSARIKKQRPVEGNGDKFKIVIKTDQYAYETAWSLKDAAGNVIKRKKYSAQNVVKDTVEVAVSEIGCYVFEITDSYGDGGATHKIFDGNGVLLVNGNKNYNKGIGYDLKLLSLVGLEEAEGVILQTLAYPNPAQDMLNLEISVLQSTKANISVVDLLGREVIRLGDVNLQNGNNTLNIETSGLQNGAYVIRIVSNDGITSKRISINR